MRIGDQLSLAAWSCGILLALAACSPGADGAGDAGSTDTPAEVIWGDAGPDGSRGSDGTPEEVADGRTGDVPGDGTAAEVVGMCLVEGSFGCPCGGPDDCLEGWCVDSPDGKVCTKTCLEECPQGWSCVQVDTGADPSFICLPSHLWICRPCTTSAQCNEGLPEGEDRCVVFGTQGAYCGGARVIDEDCPAGFLCQEMETTEDGFSKQCVAEDLECECTDKHTDAGSATFCQNQNSFGVCDGQRTCTPEGLSPCEGPIPSQEACNGVDEDCDGEIDENVMPTECNVPGEFGVCTGLTECVGGQEICVGAAAKPEVCNGLDDDCDDAVDEDFTDSDGDGQANCVDSDDDDDGVLDDVDNCPLAPNPGQGDVDGDGLGDVCDEDSDGDGDPNTTDCAPLDPLVHAGAQENCLTAYDDNCDGGTNEENGVACTAYYLDGDGDGVGVQSFLCLCVPEGPYSASVVGDCDDTDPKIHPGAVEVCETAWDDDCDGETNEEGAPGCVGYFLDDDQDGFGVGSAYCLCTGSGTVNTTIAGDCDDADQDTHPGAEELCDGEDNNCNDGIDEVFPDNDGDGAVDCLDPDDDNDGTPDVDDCQPYNPGVPTCQNKECGDDGCGGSCGVCPGGSQCDGGKCTCVPDCGSKQCGSDGCGGTCGACPPGYVCQNNLCQCLPQCAGKQCGANGCGGSCGSCPPGNICQNGWCLCQPNCAGKQCGSDGCGGDCGTCPYGYSCNASGQCQMLADPYGCEWNECGSSSAGCWCDAACWTYGDCCYNVCSTCGYCW
ncbi:MAG: MopE-related protein [Pseudomonadota bacterium]